MSRGHSQSGSQSGRRALGRCKNKNNIENVVIIDVDVVIVDAPETSQQASRGLSATRRNTFPACAINIDDEVGVTDDTPRNAHDDATSKTSSPESSSSSSTEESDSDECLMLIRKRANPSKSATQMRIYYKNGSSRNRFGLDSSGGCESESSESESSDCEIVEDSSGNFREQWERAVLRKRTLVKDRFGSGDRAGAFGSCADPISSSPETTHDKVDAENFTNKTYSNRCEDIPVEKSTSNSSNGKENTSSSDPTADNLTEKSRMETSAFGSYTDPISSSPEITHDKVDAENFTNRIYSNLCEDIPVENSLRNSSNGKENPSSNVLTADDLTEKPPQESSSFGSYADPISSSPEKAHDKVDVENFTIKTYPNLCEDVPVEENTHSSIPTANNLTENTPLQRNADISSGLPTSDRLTEEPPLKTDVNTCIADSDPTRGVYSEPAFQNIEITPEKCSYGAQSSEETLFYHKTAAFRDVIVPLWDPSSCNSRLRHDGHDVASFHEKDQISGEPSRDTESQCTLNVDHGVFCFQGKEKPVLEPSLCNNQLYNGPVLNDESKPRNHHAGGETTEMGSSDKESEDLNLLHEDLIGERERHKESDEYRRAAKEEWASRMQQLQIQAAEAQRLRRKRKAERLLLDTERRQKQRLEEVRESQRRDEETINLKEKLRAEVRKELVNIELRYRDMASLLRGLGIHVEGGAYPMSREVSAAYKRALLKFHPDRSSQADIRQQVEAEEKFKLISRLKEKLRP